MILVTGSEGFIGHHVQQALQREGHTAVGGDIRGGSVPVDFALSAYKIDAIFHLGAISDTTCDDTLALYKTNVLLTCRLANFCAMKRIPFIYASSASVYGNGDGPLNNYAASKHEADDMVENSLVMPSPWYGLRFFNVWGEGEGHKGAQASMVSQLKAARIEGRRAKLFALDARRDFVAVEDCVAVMIWLWRNLPKSGIYDVGTGVARTFRDLAGIIGVEYDEVPMPKSLEGKYQFSTKANLGPLRAAGYSAPFAPLEAAWPLQLLATKGARS